MIPSFNDVITILSPVRSFLNYNSLLYLNISSKLKELLETSYNIFNLSEFLSGSRFSIIN